MLNVSSTGCNNERQVRQPFAKLSYSTVDNVLTNLLPAGLQDFFHVLKGSNTMTTVNKPLECSQVEGFVGFKWAIWWPLPILFWLASYELMLCRQLLTDAFSHLHLLCQWWCHRIVITAEYLNAHFIFVFLFVYAQKVSMALFYANFHKLGWKAE